MPWLLFLAVGAVAYWVAKNASSGTRPPLDVPENEQIVYATPPGADERTYTVKVGDWVRADVASSDPNVHLASLLTSDDASVVRSADPNVFPNFFRAVGPGTAHLMNPSTGYHLTVNVVGAPAAAPGAREGLATSASSSDDNYAGKKDGYWVLSAKGAGLAREALLTTGVVQLPGIGPSWMDLWAVTTYKGGVLASDVANSAFKSGKAVLVDRYSLDMLLGGKRWDGSSGLVIVDESNLNALAGQEYVRLFP